MSAIIHQELVAMLREYLTFVYRERAHHFRIYGARDLVKDVSVLWSLSWTVEQVMLIFLNSCLPQTELIKAVANMKKTRYSEDLSLLISLILKRRYFILS